MAASAEQEPEEELPFITGQYECVDKIGTGSYGSVFLCHSLKGGGKLYVAKKIDLRKANERTVKSSHQEAQLLKVIKHPNIVSYIDSYPDGNGYLYIIMGYCEGGDLYHRIKQHREANPGQFMDEHQIMAWFIQVTMAIQYLHGQKIMHRDLKTQNIFLTKAEIVKVGDLGIARILEDAGDMATTVVGTPYYMSPELFNNQPYSFMSDIWALGCVLYELATLRHAFSARDLNTLSVRICRGKMPPMPTQYSAELSELLRCMLAMQADKRPRAKDILRHPYVRRHIMLYLEARQQRKESTEDANQGRAIAMALDAADKVDPVKPTTPVSAIGTGRRAPSPKGPMKPGVPHTPPKSPPKSAGKTDLNKPSSGGAAKRFGEQPFNEAARMKRRQRIEVQRRNSNNRESQGEEEQIAEEKKRRAMDKVLSAMRQTLTFDDEDAAEQNVVGNAQADTAIGTFNTLANLAHNSPFPLAVGEQTIASKTRLGQRIESLHRECLRGLGLKRFHEAWQVLLNDTSENHDALEEKLRQILPGADYDSYAAKIWNLKLCEDINAQGASYAPTRQ